MRSRRGRTLLTLLGIVLGVAVVLAIRVTNESTLESLQRVFDRATGSASLLVVSRNPSRDPLDTLILERVEGFDGVHTAAPSLRVSTLLASQAESWQLQFNISGLAAGTVLVLHGVNPELDPQVRLYTLSAGRLPDPFQYEVTLPEKSASEKGLDLGDELVILVPGGTARLRIVGLLADEGVALYNDGEVAFAPLDVIQELFDRGIEIDDVALRVEDSITADPHALEALKERLDAHLEPFAEAIYPAARGQLVGQMLATYQLGLTFFSIIAIFVGAFLIYNTFSMTIVERTHEMGMLRAIGMSRWYILRMVLAEALLLSLGGSMLGMGAGLFLARGLIALVSDLVVSGESVLQVPLQGVVQSLVVGIGVTLLAALIPALQAARISPLEALRVRSRSTQRVRPEVWMGGLALISLGCLVIYMDAWRQEVIFYIGIMGVSLVFLGATLTVTLAVSWLEAFTRPVAAVLYGNEGSLGSSNVRRAVGRTALTVASLMVALTMIIGIGSLAYSFEQDMSSWIDNALGGDLYVRSPVAMRESFARQLESVPGVGVVTPGRYLQVRVAPESLPPDLTGNETMYFNAIDPTTFRQVAGLEFAVGQGETEAKWARLAQGGAVFISSIVADRYNLRQGDQLVLLTRRGEHAFTVAAEILDFTGQGYVVTGTYSDMHRWFGESGADRFTIEVTPGYDVSVVAQEIEDRFKDRRHISVQSSQAMKESILSVMAQSFQLFDVLNLIGMIIGALGVINTLTMNVLERQREIGGLRSLGMTRGQILRMVLAEALALGVMGGVYGSGFGYIMAQVMIRGVNILMSYDLVYLFTARPFIIGALIALCVAQFAAIPPARRAATVNIVEAVKHE